MHPDNVLERRGAALAADLRLLDGPGLLALDLPRREPVIGPLLRGSVTLLRGKPGLGKSWLALSLATAAAAGSSACGWAAPRPARVLYVDAQMTLALLQARLAAIAGFGEMAPAAHPSRRGFASRETAPQDEASRRPFGPPQDEGEKKKAGRRKKAPVQDEVIVDGPQLRTIRIPSRDEPAATPAAAEPASPPRVPDTLRLLAAEAQALPMPDLGAETGRAAFMRLLFTPPATGSDEARPAFDLPAFDLVVLDGLQALLRSTRARNDPAREFAEFLAALRRAGLAVLLVDRARPRRRIAPPYEDLLDAVITVKRPPGLGEEGGVHMALTVTGRASENVEEGELRLVLDGTEGEAPGWRRVARLDAAVLAAWRLDRRGLSCRAIARALDVSHPTAWRLVRRAEALDPAVLEAAAQEMEGHLLPPAREDETAATVETGETPEPTDRTSQEWIDWAIDHYGRMYAAELNGVSPAQAARSWAAMLKALKPPPGIFLQGGAWRDVDRMLAERIGTGLDAPPPRLRETSAKPGRYTLRRGVGPPGLPPP